MKRTMLLMLTAGIITSCSLFGPSPGRITQWFALPAPGSTYTYTISTIWHDLSVSSETRDYLVERVEERDDGSTLVKFADAQRLTSFYWIVSEPVDAIYESLDTTVDDSDLLILLAPVKEGTEWTYGSGEDEADYEISSIRSRDATEVGDLRDVVEVTCEYDAVPGMELTVMWAPAVGLVLYEENYDAGASYIRRYQRELTAITPAD